MTHRGKENKVTGKKIMIKNVAQKKRKENDMTEGKKNEKKKIVTSKLNKKQQRIRSSIKFRLPY